MIDYRLEVPPILRDFLTYHETIQGHSKKTVDEYFLDLRTFFRYIKIEKGRVPRATPLDEISISDVDLALIRSVTLTDIYAFLSFLSRDRKKNANDPNSRYGLEVSSRARKVATIRSFYKYLVSKAKLLDENPIQELDSPKIRQTLPRYLTLDESIQLLESIEGDNAERDFCMITLFLNCGLRISELVGLNLSDVRDERLRVLGKGNKERTVYFSVRAKVMLQAYLEQRRGGEALFASSRAPYGPMQDRAVQKILKSLGERAAIPRRVHPHILRHTFASNAINAGMDITIIQQLLGHADPKTTLIYAELSPRMVRYEYEKLVS